MRKRLFKVSFVVASAGLAAAALSGCSRIDRYRLNPSPEVTTLGQTDDDIANRTTQTFDNNFRNLLEIGGRFLLLDRPTRLTPKPIPY